MLQRLGLVPPDKLCCFGITLSNILLHVAAQEEHGASTAFVGRVEGEEYRKALDGVEV